MEEERKHKETGINLGVEYEIEVTDKDGNVVKQIKKKSESLVKNFLILLNAAFKKGTSDVIDTGGTTRAAGAGYCVWYNAYVDGTKTIKGCGTGAGWTPTAPAGDNSYGIIVGTSDQAVSASDYNLISKIAHGNAAGQLYHYATTMLEPTVDGNTVRQRFERDFKNNSSADTTVKEIGLVVKTYSDNYLVMIIRDVLSTFITVPAAGKMRVIYRIVTGG